MAPGALLSEAETAPVLFDARPVVNEDETSLLLPSPYPNLVSRSHKDFRAELAEKGYVVLKGAIPVDRAVHYQEKAYEWLKSFSEELNFDNPSTWVSNNLPVTNFVKSYAGYCVPHEKFVWDARQESGVLDAFTTLWGTHELLVSFDSLNVTFPNRKDVPRRASWEHIDQSPRRRGVHCVQGLINLSPSGPDDGGLVVFPGSHLLNDEFMDTMTDKASWLPMKDLYLFSKTELEWFAARGVHPHKVCADVGDLIMWDSRVIHYGCEPTERSNQIRTVIYATYTPARLAAPKQLEAKKQAFSSFSGTTHWPHQYIVPRSYRPCLPDGTRDPRDREQPLEMPEMTDKLLRLAGMKPYDGTGN